MEAGVCDAARKLWYKGTRRCSISTEVWQQIKAGYAAGIGLREIARKMNVPEGTVLARAKREGWTQQIAAAKQAVALTQSNAITPLQSIAAVMQERGERYRERMADVSEKVAGHIASMNAESILTRSAQVERMHVAVDFWHRHSRPRLNLGLNWTGETGRRGQRTIGAQWARKFAPKDYFSRSRFTKVSLEVAAIFWAIAVNCDCMARWSLRSGSHSLLAASLNAHCV